MGDLERSAARMATDSCFPSPGDNCGVDSMNCTFEMSVFTFSLREQMFRVFAAQSHIGAKVGPDLFSVLRTVESHFSAFGVKGSWNLSESFVRGPRNKAEQSLSSLDN